MPQAISQFSYYNSLLEDINQGLPFRLKEINHLSPRKTGKTESTNHFIIDLSFMKTDTAVVSVRKATQDAEETFAEFVGLLDKRDLKQLCDINYTKRFITFPNGSTYRAIGITTNKKSTGFNAKGTGLRNLRAKYAILFIDEAHEVSFDETMAISEAMRGYTFFLKVKASNPWDATNEYVEYFTSHNPYNKKELIANGEKIVINGTTVFHWTHWNINHFLSPAEIEELENVRRIDPIRAETTVDGKPGRYGGGCYTDYLPEIIDIDKLPADHMIWKPYSIEIGSDWGMSEGSTTAVTVGKGGEDDWVAIYEEWGHNNKKDQQYKKGTELIKDIITFAVKTVEEEKNFGEYLQLIQETGVVINMDAAEPEVTDFLNDEIEARPGLKQWLSATPSTKLPIKIRIDAFNFGAVRKKVYLSKSKCPMLWRELEAASWELDSEGRVKKDTRGWPVRLDLNDHYINAMEYGGSDIWYNFTKKYEEHFDWSKESNIEIIK